MWLLVSFLTGLARAIGSLFTNSVHGSIVHQAIDELGDKWSDPFRNPAMKKVGSDMKLRM